MSKAPSEAAGAAMTRGDNDITVVRHNPAVLEQMAGKISHDELCDTMHLQIKREEKLENGLSSLSIKPSSSHHLQENSGAN